MEAGRQAMAWRGHGVERGGAAVHVRARLRKKLSMLYFKLLRFFSVPIWAQVGRSSTASTSKLIFRLCSAVQPQELYANAT